MKSIVLTLTASAVVLALAACGDTESNRAVCGDLVCDSSESAAGCAADCGCGNGVANPGEDCDGTDVGGATCESAVQRGGTLGCNADCTFDVTACDEYMCGNGVAEPGEDCDGSDVAGATCGSIGFSGGSVSCDANCRFDVATCCNNFCDTANTSVCVGDSVESCVTQANGCLGLEVTNCALTNDICDDGNGAASCICVDRCASAGLGHCMGAVAETCMMQADGCLDWTTNADCATTSQACAVGPQGATCVAAATGENCSDPYPISNGQNVIGWSATAADYLTANTSCNSTTMAGPDVVLAYTATVDGIATYSVSKQTNHRHVVVVSSASCGTLSAASQVSCAGTDFYSQPVMGDTFAVTQGATYYFYVRDTTSGTGTLPDPLVLDLDEAACSTLANATSNLSPANGAVLATTAPVLSFDLDHPAKTNVGVITITGTLGTSRSFDLASAPSQVTFTNDGRTVQIDPSTDFLPGEMITVSWSGLVDEFCSAPIAPPTWTFRILTPSCTPGANGMVGTTMARVPTSISSLTEYYVAPDSNPNGYVYVGGSTDLYRVPKAGGSYEDVVDEAGMTTTPLGYSMALVGSKIFTLDTIASSTSPVVWRLSTSGGVTWNPLGFGRFPMTAGATPYAMFPYNNRIYIVTNETTAGAATEIWSVSASAVALPVDAVLEGTVTTEEDCDGITGDAHYFYLTCNNNNDRIVRVDRTTFASELITDKIPLSLTKNDLHADDFDGDGRADALYIKSDDETVQYVCGPSANAPFWRGTLVEFGSATTTANYGLGFDAVNHVLWAYDDDTQELISIQ